MKTATYSKPYIRYIILINLLLFGVSAQAKDNFRLVWSNYTGSAPWGYAAKHKIIARWADKYGIHIEAVPDSDYRDPLREFFERKHDAITATNIDIISHPSASETSSTGLVIGGFSNGNDGILSRETDDLTALSGKTVHLAKHSVSHYLLYRALSIYDVDRASVSIIDANQAELSKRFKANKKSTVATWSPVLKQLQSTPQANMLFSSVEIPSEILDITLVHEDTDERFKRALTGAWYEVMSILESPDHKQHSSFIRYMSNISNSTEAELMSQLETTHFYTHARRAASFARNPSIKATMEYVRHFSRHKGLSSNAKPANYIGIKYPDGTINGDENNIIFNFTDRYMLLSANNQL